MQVSIVQCYYIKWPALVAKLIMFFQKTNYSHYALKVEYSGKKYFYDSTSSGVKSYGEVEYLKKYKIIKSYNVTQFKFISWIDFNKFFALHKGKGYGYWQAVGLLLKGWNIIKHNPFGKGAKRLICNELIILFTNHLKFTNIKDTDCLDLNDTTKILDKVMK